MKNLTRILALLLALTMTVGMLAGCGGDQPSAGNNDPVQNPENPGNEQPSGGEQPGGNQGTTGDGPKYGGHLNVRTTAAPSSTLRHSSSAETSAAPGRVE